MPTVMGRSNAKEPPVTRGSASLLKLEDGAAQAQRETNLPKVLKFLSEAPKTAEQLGRDVFGLGHSTAATNRGSKRLSSLVRAGLVKRNTFPPDPKKNGAPAQVATYELTEKGRKELAKYFAPETKP